MEDRFMDILKESLIDKWQRLKLNICGSKLFLEFIICIREM